MVSNDGTRARILAAAIVLLNRGGRDAVTTRSVAAAARVQAPTIYRLFGDMRGLLDAVADHGFAGYLKKKQVRTLSDDPVEDLRTGWSLHIQFGLSHPAIYKLMYCDPQPGSPAPAAANSHRILCAHIRRIALAGRLRVSEQRAAGLVHAAACGAVLTLLSIPEETRDMGLAELARDAVLTAITTGSPALKTLAAAPAAIALRALLPETDLLSLAERTLLKEWLDRLASE